MPSLIQKITIDGTELDLINISRTSYHESNQLDCPQVVFHLYDRDSLIDLYGLKLKSIVKVHFSDLLTNDLEQEIEFTVQSITPSKNQGIKQINCLETSIFNAIKKQPKGLFFRKKAVNFILKQLFPKITHFDIDPLPILGDFHIPSGSQINKEILDQLCRQYASMCWISRGILYFKKITNLFDQVPIATFSNNRSNTNAYQILQSYPVENENKERQISREYWGYHNENGFIKGGKIGQPQKTTDFDNKTILNNLAIGTKQILDFTVIGGGLIEPCSMINLEWISRNSLMPINESLPDKALVTCINHSIKGEQHKMRLGVSSIIQ